MILWYFKGTTFRNQCLVRLVNDAKKRKRHAAYNLRDNEIQTTRVMANNKKEREEKGRKEGEKKRKKKD